MQNTSDQPYTPGDNVVAVETIHYGYGDRAELVLRGTHGVVEDLTGNPTFDLYIEWDTGMAGSTDSAAVERVTRRR